MTKIYTHAGRFHCDEVAAVAILYLVFGGQIEVNRLTDLYDIPEDGFILDIGREYEPAASRYDHHQGDLRRSNGYPMATAGLVWHTYGSRAVELILGGLPDNYEEVIEIVDQKLIQGIDANDADSTYQVKATTSGMPVSVLTLPRIVSMFNRLDSESEVLQYQAFMDAVHLVYQILVKTIRDAVGVADSFLKVQDPPEDRYGIKYYVFDEVFPWHEAVCRTDAHFVVMPSEHPGSPWVVLAVPVAPGSREVRTKITRPDGFEGFIHQGQWVAGCLSKQQAIQLVWDQRPMRWNQ